MKTRFLCLAGLMLAILTESADAGFLSITNAGFEDPPTSGYINNSISAWTIGGSGGAGVWNINNYPLGFWTVNAPEGKQVAFLSQAPAPGLQASISQILADTLQSGTVYTLSGYVGHPIGFGSVTTVFTAELFAGTHLLESVSGTGPAGTFAGFQFGFDSTGSAYVGEALKIVLSSNQAQTAFDDIRLFASSPIPEPSSLAMFCIGAIGMVFARRKRKQRTLAV